MRGVYETERDRQNEAVVMDLLCRKWRCQAVKAPRFYEVDWSLVSKARQVLAMVEVKFRHASYPTYLLSLHKFTSMCLSSKTSGLPYLLVVCWPENGVRSVYFLKVTEGVHASVVLGGRKDRGDPEDVEPMVEIPMSKFKKVGEL